MDRRKFLSSGMLVSAGAALRVAGDEANAWPSENPAGCPFTPSAELGGIRFTGRHREYTNADTWFPTWAPDGNLYSPWTDGYVVDGAQGYQPFDQALPGYPCNSLDYRGRKAATAQARIEGDDPLALRIVNLKPRVEASPQPYGGRYPCGSLTHRGIWYYGTYCLTNDGRCGDVGWTEMGPLVGFRISRDYGRSWEETTHTPLRPLFGEDPKLAPVKIGSPHFVDFGRDMDHSPDGRAYLVAHGGRRTRDCNNWIQGDAIYLLRVMLSPASINDAKAWEFFAGHDREGHPVWSGDFDKIEPLAQWKGHLGCATMTYHPGLGRYLICVTRGVRQGHFDTMILESAAMTGPWRLVHYLRNFGPEAYFVNVPSKFISATGRSFWLCYSANWSNKASDGTPFGSRYALCLHEAELVER